MKSISVIINIAESIFFFLIPIRRITAYVLPFQVKKKRDIVGKK